MKSIASLQTLTLLFPRYSMYQTHNFVHECSSSVKYPHQATKAVFLTIVQLYSANY